MRIPRNEPTPSLEGNFPQHHLGDGNSSIDQERDRIQQIQRKCEVFTEPHPETGKLRIALRPNRSISSSSSSSSKRKKRRTSIHQPSSAPRLDNPSTKDKFQPPFRIDAPNFANIPKPQTQVTMRMDLDMHSIPLPMDLHQQVGPSLSTSTNPSTFQSSLVLPPPILPNGTAASIFASQPPLLRCEMCGNEYSSRDHYHAHLMTIHSISTENLPRSSPNMIVPTPPKNLLFDVPKYHMNLSSSSRLDETDDRIPSDPGSEFTSRRRKSDSHYRRKRRRSRAPERDISQIARKSRRIRKDSESSSSSSRSSTSSSESRSSRKRMRSKSGSPKMDKKQRVSACHVCGKGITTSNLKRHILTIHLQQKPFGCGICDKRFARKEGLQRHGRFHPGKDMYPCYVCHERFRDVAEWTTHLRKCGWSLNKLLKDKGLLPDA